MSAKTIVPETVLSADRCAVCKSPIEEPPIAVLVVLPSGRTANKIGCSPACAAKLCDEMKGILETYAKSEAMRKRAETIPIVDTAEEQLLRWVAGESVHLRTKGVAQGPGAPRTAITPRTDYSCCPDFSCCRPELLADEATRRAFAAGDDRTRTRFLGFFLGAALDGKAYVSTGEPPETPS